MIIYLLKMIACSAAFYALYALVFQKEKMLVFNRWYQLCSLMLSFAIPLITFVVKVPATHYVYNVAQQPAALEYTQIEPSHFQDYFMNAVYAIAVMVSFILLIRFVKNIIQLQRCLVRYKTFVFSGAKISLIDKPIEAHSFLNTVFLNKTEYEQGRVEAQVLAHELAHIKQRHSYDILFIELLQIFCWFNPMIYLYKRSIKINHELLADAAVVKQFGNVHDYQQILLQRSLTKPTLWLASSFNFYTTKKRFIMLQKTYRKRKAALLSFWVLPLLLGLTFTFCNRVEKKAEEVNKPVAVNSGTNDSSQVATAGQHPDSAGISETEMNEFKSLIEKSSKLVDGKRYFLMSKKTFTNKAFALYNIMKLFKLLISLRIG